MALQKKALPTRMRLMEDSETSNPATEKNVAALPPQTLPENFDAADPDNIELCTNAETTRVGRWKNRLLDLSLRNTLLNFNARAAASGTLRFVVHDIGEFENALASEGVRFEIVSEEMLGSVAKSKKAEKSAKTRSYGDFEVVEDAAFVSVEPTEQGAPALSAEETAIVLPEKSEIEPAPLALEGGETAIAPFVCGAKTPKNVATKNADSAEEDFDDDDDENLISVTDAIAPEEDVPADRREELLALAKKIFPKKRLLAEVPKTRSRKVSETDRIRERLAKIFRTSNNAIAETGANTLSVALGFLRWKYHKRPGETLLAPLVLIPAKLERSRGENRFFLRASDEDVRLNLTLAEMLRQEFGIVIPALESALPEDESGVDIAKIFSIFREAISGQEGFSVEESCALGNFSFAKYLMWRDLEERPEMLARSRIVRHLMDETRSPFESEKAFLEPKRLDETLDAGRLLCPLSADSSQLAAVHAATEGKNFILVGPPGTGKSQTIANLISHAVASGKTVLFVAEKSAALEVVFRRLKKIGVGDFCLELHSDKTNKRAAYNQFAASLELASAGDASDSAREHAAAASEVQALKMTLLQHPQILHKKRENGLSLADAVGVICTGEALPELDLLWENPLADSANIRERKLKIAGELKTAFEETHGTLAKAAGKIATQKWSQAWQRSAEGATKALETAARKLARSVEHLCEIAGTEPSAKTLEAQKSRLALLASVLAVRGENADLITESSSEAQLETLRAAATLAENCAAHKTLLSLPYGEDAPNAPELDALLKTWQEAEISWIVPRWLKRRKVVRALRMLAGGSTKLPQDPRVDLGNLIAIRTCKKDFSEKYSAIAAAFPSLIKDCESTGVLPRIEALQKAQKLVAAALKPLEDDVEKYEDLRDSVRRWADGNAATDKAAAALSKALAETQSALAAFAEAKSAFSAATGAFEKEEFESTDAVAAFVAEALADRESWRDICAWNAVATAAERRGMAALAAAVRDGSIAPDAVLPVFEVNYCRRWAEAVYDAEPALLDYVSGKNISRINKFRAADAALRAASGKLIRKRLIERSRGVFNKKYASELSLLRHEIEKKRAHLPIRRFLAQAPQMLRLLKPCLLTSPLSAAQYLDVSAEPFDLVVFDEASQISVWDAVGALARGNSAVVVGDPKQLPPTSFFQTTKFENEESESSDAPAQNSVADAESVLDECRACGVPAMKLSWHYRSRAEMLIAFSNARYYAGNLMTFPAPKTQDRSLEYVFCENGIYNAGTSRTNREEAQALVERVVAELTRPGFVYNEFSSVGIVTFNAQQQALILRLLRDAREARPEIRKFFSEEEVAEPVFVKNLENVQGDERGVIYFSTTFGPDAQGNIGQNFGPLNREGGERRLNVAITRSRAGMRVFTSLRPNDIRTSRGGMADLRDFLEFARSGELPSQDGNAAATGNASETNLPSGKAAEDALAASLEARGWKCRRNVGFSGMRVDIAVVHPDREEEFIAGILCDGSDAMTIPTVRDREILREEVLKNLGWNVLRAWGLDRWQTPELCVSRLDERLRKLLEKSRVPAPIVPAEKSA